MNKTSNNFEFEICANSVESCLAAQEGGADRVELCAGISEGGTTPSFGDIVTARRLLSDTKLHVIIRPRGGDFTYSDLEMDIMAADIDACKQAGVDGVVFGCLTPEGDIDIERNAKLMAHVGNMAATFHRAFDRCRNPLDALDQLEELGFNRVLTSGQQKTAEKGIPLLYKLQKKAGKGIAIMAGCGVNERNIFKIHGRDGCDAVPLFGTRIGALVVRVHERKRANGWQRHRRKLSGGDNGPPCEPHHQGASF